MVLLLLFSLSRTSATYAGSLSYLRDYTKFSYACYIKVGGHVGVSIGHSTILLKT